MSKFKVGEIAIYQNLTEYPDFNGEECEIVREEGFHADTETPFELTYLVKDRAGIFCCRETELRKLPPKDEPTTWNECVWKPTKIKESS